MQGLDHAHVLMFHEWYETPKHIWVITELASGGTLADILEQDGCIPFPQVVDFVRDIASGLSYVHSRQIVYCDLQPHKVGTSLVSQARSLSVSRTRKEGSGDSRYVSV